MTVCIELSTISESIQLIRAELITCCNFYRPSGRAGGGPGLCAHARPAAWPESCGAWRERAGARHCSPAWLFGRERAFVGD